MDTCHWDVLVTYHWEVVGCFIWDLFETSWRRTVGRRCYVLLRRCHDVPIRRRGDVLLRRLGDVPTRRRWVFHLGRTCDVTGTYRETSLRRRHDVLLLGRLSVAVPSDNLQGFLIWLSQTDISWNFPMCFFPTSILCFISFTDSVSRRSHTLL